MLIKEYPTCLTHIKCADSESVITDWKNVHLLQDAVQGLWSADIKAYDDGIGVWIRKRPDVVIIRGACNTKMWTGQEKGRTKFT